MWVALTLFASLCAADEPVNINTADATTIQSIVGIGPDLAVAIVADRETHGPFRTLNDLARVSGLGRATLENARQHLTLGDVESHEQRTQPTQVDVNSATAAELSKLPGIHPHLAERILVERQRNGAFVDCQDLARVDGIGPATVALLDDSCVARR